MRGWIRRGRWQIQCRVRVETCPPARDPNVVDIGRAAGPVRGKHGDVRAFGGGMPNVSHRSNGDASPRHEDTKDKMKRGDVATWW